MQLTPIPRIPSTSLIMNILSCIGAAVAAAIFAAPICAICSSIGFTGVAALAGAAVVVALIPGGVA